MLEKDTTISGDLFTAQSKLREFYNKNIKQKPQDILESIGYVTLETETSYKGFIQSNTLSSELLFEITRDKFNSNTFPKYNCSGEYSIRFSDSVGLPDIIVANINHIESQVKLIGAFFNDSIIFDCTP